MTNKITPSRLRDYLLCQRLYQARHLEGRQAQTASTPALAFGNSLHAALEALHRSEAPIPPALLPAALLRRHWRSEGYASPEQEAEQFAVGVEALARYSQTRLPLAGRVLSTELYLSRMIVQDGLRFELSGRIDRLTLLPDGTLEVLDYKTNHDGQVPAELALDLPTFIYYVLARMAYPDYLPVVVAQLNLLSLQETRADYSADRRAMLKGDLLMVAAEMEFRHYPPHPGTHCAWCPVKDTCPAYGTENSLDSV